MSPKKPHIFPSSHLIKNTISSFTYSPLQNQTNQKTHKTIHISTTYTMNDPLTLSISTLPYYQHHQTLHFCFQIRKGGASISRLRTAKNILRYIFFVYQANTETERSLQLSGRRLRRRRRHKCILLLIIYLPTLYISTYIYTPSIIYLLKAVYIKSHCLCYKNIYYTHLHKYTRTSHNALKLLPCVKSLYIKRLSSLCIF